LKVETDIITGNTASLLHMNSNQIIHKHVHVDYNPLKGMLVHISSLKLSIVPYAAGPETQGHSRTVYGYILMSNCFPSFIVHWIFNFVNQSTHENHKQNWYPTKKSDFTVSEHFVWKQIERESPNQSTSLFCVKNHCVKHFRWIIQT
jgi:hypothetical protein